ncbi:AFG1 family ATPase, partial [Rhizoctonia solani AG-3 Rhs1AP]
MSSRTWPTASDDGQSLADRAFAAFDPEWTSPAAMLNADIPHPFAAPTSPDMIFHIDDMYDQPPQPQPQFPRTGTLDPWGDQAFSAYTHVDQLALDETDLDNHGGNFCLSDPTSFSGSPSSWDVGSAFTIDPPLTPDSPAYHGDSFGVSPGQVAPFSPSSPFVSSFSNDPFNVGHKSTDRARRFISLIDALYEARVKIVCMAEAEIDNLFFPEELKEGEIEGSENERTMMEEALSEGNVIYRPNISTYQPTDRGHEAEQKSKKLSSGKEGLSLKELSIFTGQDEKFAYARAASRLVQMTSPKYAANVVWQPLTRAQQPWHVDALPSRSSTHVQIPKFATGEQIVENDWAEEASYDARRGRKGRPEPPRLSENHAWGVRDDWGKGAGEWGKAVKGKAK